ncbi:MULTISPECIES: hypothetical protein [unclassified Arcicella]|nr:MULTISPECIES: hypothetical protein [unclassified Arcicella]MDR6559938.1 hypothetical protein [Arcicella sp. BE51]MDR6810455.1 hypothetical protein [Arcicella sp. BE140]MDR6821805.1 hypothetical protein [Arcicella sp. BE139]
MKNKITYLILLLSLSFSFFAQQPSPENTYPKIVGYMGILHPITTWSADGTSTSNFGSSYTIGFPTGINILKSDKIGFSFEFVPTIRSENGVSKVNNFLFHPGVMFRFKHGLTLVTRAAFETGGRYGFTPVLNKVVKKNKHSNYFIAVPLPVRFGNDKPTSYTLGFQFGVGF